MQTKYDWDGERNPLPCPHCGETAMPLAGRKSFECYGCGSRFIPKQSKDKYGCANCNGDGCELCR